MTMPDLDNLTLEAAVAIILQDFQIKVELLARLTALEQQVVALQQENAELRARQGGSGGSSPKPDWVKANRPQQTPKQRKKRDHSFARTKETPTQVHVHFEDNCPDCGRKLAGGWEHRTRQVIEIPFVPVEVIEHVVMARHCGVCDKRIVPKLDLSSAAIGKHRLGVRLMCFIVWLHEIGRMPIRRIQALLEALYGLHIASGEICDVLHAVAEKGEAAYNKLKESVRAHPFVHADETGWRQNGVNGYLWSFSTPTVRFFTYNKSRSHEVPESVLGSDFKGVLCSDFYGGYNYHMGEHQRCWVHFLRDLDDLEEKHKDQSGVHEWAKRVRSVYDRAKQYANPDAAKRRKARTEFQNELAEIAKPYARSDCAQRVLAMRIERFLPELFAFIEYPEVASSNNAAERAIRPCVIARKVSGGTRSAKGSETRSVLMSLFATWQAQGLDVLSACQAMLTGNCPTAIQQA